ncbi:MULTISPECIES: hypothetical protein [Vreelandella]|uniref:Uncharacterized protein n=2 Tax=Vreelandella TaxID=3137766 RepID=A0A7C9P449_9GAMM|nr:MULTISPECIES: hypothetical protein [Halomonas]NDL71176.1 hypothetical protein [Halomonas alkaliphila]NYS44947.1 hypothetical protein [Halomonas zhaodongensis]
MRDLYQRLSLAPGASDQAIKNAVARCPNSALRQDAEATLAVSEHRHIYDNLHKTVSDIGQLRARLGLTHGAHWQGDVANDFSLPPDNAISRHDELIDRVSFAVSLHNRWQRFRGPWLLVTLFAAGAGIGLAFGLALGLGLGMG